METTSVAQATTGRMPADNSKAPPLRSNHPWGKPTCNTAENSNNQQQETSPPSWTQQTNWLYRATRGTSSPLQEIEPTKQLQEAQHIRLHIAASTATPAARRGSSKPSRTTERAANEPAYSSKTAPHEISYSMDWWLAPLHNPGTSQHPDPVVGKSRNLFSSLRSGRKFATPSTL